MSDFDEPAYPQFMPDAWNKPRITGGLTIRQQAVLMMAQGLCANITLGDRSVSRLAVAIADAVLELERETREGGE